MNLEILLDDSIRKTFLVNSFMPQYHTVQKVADKEVSPILRKKQTQTRKNESMNLEIRIVSSRIASERTIS